MKDKFDIKDYLNYSISGLLWIIIIVGVLQYFSVIRTERLFELMKWNELGMYVMLFLLFGSYLIGNLFRRSDRFLIRVTEKLYGDLYYTALSTDKKKCEDSTEAEDRRKLGYIYNWLYKKSGESTKGESTKTEEKGQRCFIYCWLKKKGKSLICCVLKEPLAIRESLSIKIEHKLEELEIICAKDKKSQFLMCETYLILNYNNTNLKYERLKNLRDLYESISCPVLLISLCGIYLVFSNDLEWYYVILFSLFSIWFIWGIISRYQYLQSNYIKEVYRSFVLINHKANTN